MIPIMERTPFQVGLLDESFPDTYIPTDYLLIYVVSGSCGVQINKESFECSAGDVFIVHPEDSYTIHSDHAFMICMVRMDFHFIVRCCDYERPSFVPPGSSPILTSYGSARQALSLIEKIHDLADLFMHEPRPSVTRMSYLFYEFAYYFIENYRVSKPAQEGSYKQKRIYAILDYIESNYNMPITLSSLAKELGLTPQYVAGFIKKNMNTTFNTLLFNTRFKFVLLELRESNEDITRIILNNGFSSASGFNRLFRKRYAMTPTQYRKCSQSAAAKPDKAKRNELAYRDLVAWSRSLYPQFLAARQSGNFKHSRHQKLSLSAGKTRFIENPWRLLVNVGNARNCQSFDYFMQISQMQKHIAFKYARMSRLIHPEILLPGGKDVEILFDGDWAYLNFSQLDGILDNFKQLGLTPFIVIEPEAYSGFFSIQTLCKIVKSVLLHAMDRYGAGDIAQWKLEFMQPPYMSDAQYAQEFSLLYSALGTLDIKIALGGPFYALERGNDGLRQLLELCRQSGCFPDFISLSVYPYSEKGRISLNPEINIKRLRQLTQTLKQKLPLYITDLGFTHMPRSYLNDSLFMADYMLKNFIALGIEAQLIAWSALSDHTVPGHRDMERLLDGSPGLITAQNIQKPTFFAVRYLSSLGNRLLGMGKNYIASIDANECIEVLLFNYKHPDAHYCQENAHKITLAEKDLFYSDDTELHIQLSIDAPGHARYQAAHFCLNADSGSILDTWALSGEMQGIRQDTLNYLRHSLVPRLKFYEVETAQSLEVDETLLPQEIIFINFSPVMSGR